MRSHCIEQRKPDGYSGRFGLLAVLFNPIIPVHLSREIWAPIDMAAALFWRSLVWFFSTPKYLSPTTRKILMHTSRMSLRPFSSQGRFAMWPISEPSHRGTDNEEVHPMSC